MIIIIILIYIFNYYNYINIIIYLYSLSNFALIEKNKNKELFKSIKVLVFLKILLFNFN